MSKFYFECQNEVNENACYHTLDLEAGARKYKKGFVCVLEDDNAVSLCGMNSVEEFAKLLNAELSDFRVLDGVGINCTVRISGSGTFIRIW